MKTLVPDYFPLFACLMGECRHSCCIGWEIDIDEDTLEIYRTMPGEIGQMLKEHIDDSGESACFRLTEDDERCPFLRRDGLCRLIIECGEDSLCQICADHPRFRNFFSDRTEIGLGMSCEAAARLILTREAPASLIVTEDDGEHCELTRSEDYVLVIRDSLIEAVQKRSRPLLKRLSYLAAHARLHIMERPINEWAEFMLTLERLDDEWTARLQALAQTEGLSALNPWDIPLDSRWDIPFEQLMVYLLYRHLSIADSQELTRRFDFCLLMWSIIRALFARTPNQTMDELIEICRLYSSEIEYSDENIFAVIDEMNELDMDIEAIKDAFFSTPRHVFSESLLHYTPSVPVPPCFPRRPSSLENTQECEP